MPMKAGYFHKDVNNQWQNTARETRIYTEASVDMHFKDSDRMNAYFLCRPVSLSMNLTFNAPTRLCQKVLLFTPRR